MEVIVDDSQLSLAIGKKGQNVRLAAKLLGWKIDIKSEEEKRQEVQNAIELLSTGVPVSALIEHGLAEATVDALVKGDIGTVEKLGSMTPEQLEALEGIDQEAVSRIQQAINSFYGQEYAEEPEPLAEAAAPEAIPEADRAGVETSSDTMVESAEPAIDKDIQEHTEPVSAAEAADDSGETLPVSDAEAEVQR
jgi:N utilization substance protein A